MSRGLALRVPEPQRYVEERAFMSVAPKPQPNPLKSRSPVNATSPAVEA